MSCLSVVNDQFGEADSRVSVVNDQFDEADSCVSVVNDQFDEAVHELFVCGERSV